MYADICALNYIYNVISYLLGNHFNIVYVYRRWFNATIKQCVRSLPEPIDICSSKV